MFPSKALELDKLVEAHLDGELKPWTILENSPIRFPLDQWFPNRMKAAMRAAFYTGFEAALKFLKEPEHADPFDSEKLPTA